MSARRPILCGQRKTPVHLFPDADAGAAAATAIASAIAAVSPTPLMDEFVQCLLNKDLKPPSAPAAQLQGAEGTNWLEHPSGHPIMFHPNFFLNCHKDLILISIESHNLFFA